MPGQRSSHAAIDSRLGRPPSRQVDTRPDVRVAQLAASQWGVASLEELRQCGLSDDAVRVRVCNGGLHPMHRAVYAVGHANPPLQGRFLAAVKACGSRGVLSHFSAAALWTFLDWEDRYPEVTVSGPATRIHPGLRVHRTSAFDCRDVTRHEGIPVTAPARTMLDLASVLDFRPLRRAVRQAQSLQRVSIRQLVDVLDRAGPRRGVRKLARIVATGPVPTRSELEDIVLALMLRGGLERPDVNVPLVVAGRRLVPDFRWPERRLVVEADGAIWHDSKLAREDDAERQALLELYGERVLRVTWEQAIRRPRETLSRMRVAGAPLATDCRVPRSQAAELDSRREGRASG